MTTKQLQQHYKTLPNISDHIQANINTLTAMAEKAERTGKKVNGFTASDLRNSIDNYKRIYNIQ